MKGKANFDVYLAEKKKQEFMGSKTTVSHRLARSHSAGVQMAGNKREKHVWDIGSRVCTSIRSIYLHAHRQIQRRRILYAAITLRSVCTCLCVWTGYTDHKQHPESQASVPP